MATLSALSEAMALWLRDTFFPNKTAKRPGKRPAEGFGVRHLKNLCSRRHLHIVTVSGRHDFPERCWMSAGPIADRTVEFERWYQIGLQSVEQQSWQYALECLSKAVEVHPDHRDARKQKHRASRRVFKQVGKLSRAESLKLSSIKSRLTAAEARGDLESVDRLAEQILAKNPWDAPVFAAIARAAEKRRANEIAEYAWMCAVKIDDTQAKWFRALGDLLHRSGRHKEAKGCYSRLQQLNPAASGGAELMQAVDVALLMRDGGVHLRRVDERDDSGAATEGQVPSTVSDPRKEAEGLIHQAEEFVRSDQLGQAIELYSKATEFLPDNQSVQDRSDDIELALLRKRASAAASAAQASPDSSQQLASAQQHARTCHDREFEILQKRVRRDEADLLQAFRLADLCRRTNRLQQAIHLFQKCVDEKELHAESLIGIGECCLRSKQAGTGRRHLESALQQITVESHPKSFQLAHYWLGRYFEAAGAKPQSIWHFRKVADVDGSFRDTAVRLKQLNQGREA